MTSSRRSETKLNTAPWISGVLGGSASTILLYPLDLVKVRWQVKEDPTNLKEGTKLPRQRRSIVSTMRGIVRHEGASGLYQGLTPALVGSALSWGGYFFLYEGIKLRMIERKQWTADVTSEESKDGSPPDGEIRLAPLDNFAAACTAGAAMVACTNPIWLIKTRMQLQLKSVESQHVTTSGPSSDAIKPPYKNMVDAARTIVREEGLLALYKGAAPAMMLTSHGGVQFVTYEYLKTNFGTYTKAQRSVGGGGKDGGIVHQLQDSMGYLTMGAVSKIIASTVTYPLQVIKSRLQQRDISTELSSTGKVQIVKREYAGVLDCVTRIWKREGVVGFFKGCLPNAIRVAPNAAITLVVYESFMTLLS